MDTQKKSTCLKAENDVQNKTPLHFVHHMTFVRCVFLSPE